MRLFAFGILFLSAFVFTDIQKIFQFFNRKILLSVAKPASHFKIPVFGNHFTQFFFSETYKRVFKFFSGAVALVTAVKLIENFIFKSFE